MSPSYLPILKAKPGEFRALSHTEPRRKREMLPLFEVARMGENTRKAKRFQHVPHLTCAYLDEVAENIAQVWAGRQALADAFHWRHDARTETGEHVVPYLYARLSELGVGVIPVVGYDRWDSPSYRLAMKGIPLRGDAYYCLRLDSHAIDDAEDPEYFLERIVEIVNELGVTAGECAVLIDFGDVTAVSVEKLIAQSATILDILVPMGFRFYSCAGCSLPPSIDGAVRKENSTGRVLRKEMLVWQALRASYPLVSWLFGDYGVRSPNAADDVISPHTNGKIRHTIPSEFFVARGHSMQKADKGAQMYKLADLIVNSPHYLGPNFSWGDAQILECSEGKFPGNSTTWIAIDTSHHSAWVIQEIAEFESKVTRFPAGV